MRGRLVSRDDTRFSHSTVSAISHPSLSFIIMAKGIAKPRPKGQKSIASFFGGTNGKTKADEASAASSDVDMDEPEATTRTAKKTAKASKKANPKADEASAASSDADMDESEVATARTTKKPVKAAKKAKPKVDREYSDDEADEADEITTGAAKKGGKSDVLTGELPPIHEIPKIFADLVSHIPKIKDVVEHVNGRKLRVATMCSGTESPLLALELIQESIHEEHGLKLEIEHVFSCEIEPFKQAYIERNFHPPLLFRDVCELGQAEAYVNFTIGMLCLLNDTKSYGIWCPGAGPRRRGSPSCWHLVCRLFEPQ